jgi:outer membrane receptor protein involved in Fe transport
MMVGISIAALASGMAAAPAASQSSVSSAPADEIIVTAQKRAERLIDVPSSVTALSSNALIARGAARFEDYKAFVPGLSAIEGAPGYNQINIRGITTGANQLSSTVGTYFDEAPTNSSTSAALGVRLTPDPDLLDVARIEVLRGPQGTLYGANALGGVVKYVLAQPDLDAVHGQGQAGIASVAHGGTGYAARAIVSVPVVTDWPSRRAASSRGTPAISTTSRWVSGMSAGRPTGAAASRCYGSRARMSRSRSPACISSARPTDCHRKRCRARPGGRTTAATIRRAPPANSSTPNIGSTRSS